MFLELLLNRHACESLFNLNFEHIFKNYKTCAFIICPLGSGLKETARGKTYYYFIYFFRESVG